MRVGSKAETVALALESEIERSGLTAGDSLGTKSDLASRFSVSPGTLNEALRLLQSGGVIGLAIGYVTKYHLDRKYVFRQEAV